MSKSYMEEYQRWLDSPALSEEEWKELNSIAGDEKEIENRFYAPLEFGTAGLRGTMKLGLHNMNIHIIRHATQAFANVILADGDDAKVVSYTDIVGALMSSVTTIVNMISYVLVAFVAISLVVSSIMIGVITYISVLERKKEIGILRSIGASKGDISRVFNAETIIVGFTAGVIGIGLTALACIPANAIVYSLFDVRNVAILPWQAAVVLVGISVLLTFLAGLIPSSAASRKDPVEALRSE